MFHGVQTVLEIRVGPVNMDGQCRHFVPSLQRDTSPTFLGDVSHPGRNVIVIPEFAYSDFFSSVEMQELFTVPVYAFAPDPAIPWQPGIYRLEWDHYFVVNVVRMFYESWAADHNLVPRLNATLEESTCAQLIKLDWWIEYALKSFPDAAIQISVY